MNLVLPHQSSPITPDLARSSPPALPPRSARPPGTKISHPAPTTLTARHLQAVDLIAAGKTVTETARIVGVAKETVSGWGQSQVFQAAVQEQILERRAWARARLESLVEPALAALEQQLTDPETPPALRQKAALAILDRAGYGSGVRGGGSMEEVEGGAEVARAGLKLDQLSMEEKVMLLGVHQKLRGPSG